MFEDEGGDEDVDAGFDGWEGGRNGGGGGRRKRITAMQLIRDILAPWELSQFPLRDL